MSTRSLGCSASRRTPRSSYHSTGRLAEPVGIASSARNTRRSTGHTSTRNLTTRLPQPRLDITSVHFRRIRMHRIRSTGSAGSGTSCCGIRLYPGWIRCRPFVNRCEMIDIPDLQYISKIGENLRLEHHLNIDRRRLQKSGPEERDGEYRTGNGVRGQLGSRHGSHSPRSRSISLKISSVVRSTPTR